MYNGPYDERIATYGCDECGKKWDVKEELWIEDSDGSQAWFGANGCECGTSKTPVEVTE